MSPRSTISGANADDPFFLRSRYSRPDDPDLLGVYEGVPHTERADYGLGFVMPDRIVIYRLPICAMCETEDEVVDEVLVTVVHELAHHFGIDDDELERLGWA